MVQLPTPHLIDGTESELPTFVSPVLKQFFGLSQKHSWWTVWISYPIISESCWISFLASRSLCLLLSVCVQLLPSFSSPLSHMAEEVVQLVHHPGLALPPGHPCDWSNGFNTRTLWTSEELHMLLAAIGSTTTNISFRPALMAND